ncbi:hypothetical protein QQP08_015488 [Theobroma cacao]|nr:hypothetical protein QQP08_015488 [Theobroma cacao]
MKGVHFLSVAFSLLALASSFASTSDPSPLQDFYVAINGPKDGANIFFNPVGFVNGKFCKDPKLTKAEDFLLSGPNMPRNTSNRVGSNVITVNVDKIPGLNTLGGSLPKPGVITIANAVFGSNPAINSDVLVKAFQLDINVVKYLQSQF